MGSTVDFETAQHRLFEEHGLDPRSRFVDVRDPPVRTHVFETGQVADEPPLVFVHGTAAFGGFFAPLLAQLEDRWTITFDRPGYGSSDGFTYRNKNVRRSIGNAIGGVLDELGLEQVDLVGHSMGGHGSLLYALARPDRVRRLILFGALPGFPGTRPPTPIRLSTVPLVDRVVRRLQKPGEEAVLDFAEIFGERDSITRYPALVGSIAAHEANLKSAQAGRSEFESLIWAGGWRSGIRIPETALRRIQPPTTVVWGSNDTLGRPGDVRDAVELIPDVRFETVTAGHVPFWSRPERCARIIDAATMGATADTV